uniref:NADH-ubiquinone oxidoreductase chain 4L n=1 Tax=Stygobromus foliatus TaxID=1678291 RepID=A0A172QHE9_9CRUS|nr:NADH dehydrogenase subunit 4L [Stygobromus foliatus]
MLKMTALMGATVILSGAIKFISNYVHLLNSLLSLEFISLGLFWLMSLEFLENSLWGSQSLYFMIMIVCEGVIGLSLLVSCTRSFSSDNMSTNTTLGC